MYTIHIHTEMTGFLFTIIASSGSRVISPTSCFFFTARDLNDKTRKSGIDGMLEFQLPQSKI